MLSENDSPLCSLSVIVVTIYSSTHLARCLVALEQQIGRPDMETIVVCDEIIDDVSALRRQFPSVQFYHASGRQTEEKLLSMGVRLARGRIIALTVDHCTPEKHWCARIMREHESPHAAVGGAIEMGSQPNTALNWAIHFYDEGGYGFYLNPVQRGPARNLSLCNVSYKQVALAKIADLWTNRFHVPAVNQALHACGERLWLSPDLVVYQHRSMNFKQALREPYSRGYSFARMRAKRSTAGKRIFYTLFSPLLPILQLGRLVLNVHRKKSHVSSAFTALPFVALLATLWSWGEFVGYLKGPKEIIPKYAHIKPA